MFKLNVNSVKIWLIVFLCCMICVSCNPKKIEESYIERTGFVFDTVVNFRIYGTKDEKILDEIMQLCQEMELMFSAHNVDSKLYQLNHREKGERKVKLQDDLLSVIQKAQEISHMSNGAFDITIRPVLSLWDFQSENPKVPPLTDIEREIQKVDYSKIIISGNEIIFENGDTKIDLGAIAKGYIADKVKEYLMKQDIKSAIIDLGGNVLCIGEKPGGENYKVGIREPFAEEQDKLGYVLLKNASVVSSGVYERNFMQDGVNYHHILDTETGFPIQNGLTQVTIITESSMLADALSTTCFALGEEKGLEFVKKFPNTYAYFVHEDKSITFSEGAKEIFFEER